MLFQGKKCLFQPDLVSKPFLKQNPQRWKQQIRLYRDRCLYLFSSITTTGNFNNFIAWFTSSFMAFHHAEM